jgi:hypothetical protein
MMGSPSSSLPLPAPRARAGGIALPYAKFSIYLLWFSAAFDPVGLLFGIRYIALLSIIGLIGLLYVEDRRSMVLARPYSGLLALFTVAIPVYGLVVGLARGGLNTEFADTSYLAAAAYFLCSIVYLKPGYLAIAEAAMVAILRLLSLTIVACLVSSLAGYSTDWIYFFVEHGITFYGERDYADLSFAYIYFIASPMIVFLLVRDTWRLAQRPSLGRALLLLVPIVALFLSGTRANMAIALFGALFTAVWCRYGRAAAFATLTVPPLLLAVASLSDLDFAREMLSTSEGSNSVKIEYLRSYAEIFSDPVTLIFGQGFNAQTWSNPLARMVVQGATKTELTYIEIYRVFGALFGSLLIGTLGFMCLSNTVNRAPAGWIAPASLLYLFVTALNPYLFSSNGMLLLGLAAVAMQSRKPATGTS